MGIYGGDGEWGWLRSCEELCGLKVERKIDDLLEVGREMEWFYLNGK